MLLGSPPDMVHRAPAHGAHIRMQNSAIYSPVRFKYYTIPFGKLQVAVLYRLSIPRKMAY